MKNRGVCLLFDFDGVIINSYDARLKLPLVPGMGELLTTLAKKQELFIISSTNNRPINAFLAEHNLTHTMTEILGYDVEPDKPTKIKYVLKTYGYKPDQALFITDTVGDIEQGKSLGVPVIAVTWGYHDQPTLIKANPWKIATSPSELETAINLFVGSRV